MGNSYGPQNLGTIGPGWSISADGAPEVKIGGITIDWSTVTAVSADTVLPGDFYVESGKKCLRLGQVVCLIGTAEVQTLTFTGGPTAGTTIITLPADGDFEAASAPAVAFNASAADMEAALEQIPRISDKIQSVARAGAGSAGDPYVYTVTFKLELGNIPQFTGTHTFTGGTTPTITPATTTPGAGSGMYGPFDSAASDGRQTLTRGRCYIIESSVREDGLHSNHPTAVEGGLLDQALLLITDGTNSLAAGPTVTNFLAAFPRVRLMRDG